jgi:predicted amidohydrolase
MKKILYGFLGLLFLIITSYIIWSRKDRITSINDIYPRYVLSDVESFGTDNGRGNLLALSPYVHTHDFSSEQAFYNMLEYYLSFAQRKKLLNDSTIVVLPEYLGTWLVAANEKKEMYKDTSITDALQRIVFSNLWSYGNAYLSAKGTDKQKDAIFRMKANSMCTIYQNTFSKLAQQFKITIVAGSIVLPEPEIKNGILTIHSSGKLFNVSVVYNKNGKALSPLIKKTYTVSSEKSFTANAASKDLPIYKTIAGNLGILIGGDAWNPENYTALQQKQVAILAVPAFVAGNNSWDIYWNGYVGGKTPADVDKNDFGKITEQMAWLKYAMTKRAKTANIKNGVNVFLRGDLWNIGSDGQTIVWTNDTAVLSKNTQENTGSLINIWL